MSRDRRGKSALTAPDTRQRACIFPIPIYTRHLRRAWEFLNCALYALLVPLALLVA